MQLSKDKMASLVKERKISQNGLARLINIRPGSLSNAISGNRGVGRQILSALLREFEGESVASLTMKGGDAQQKGPQVLQHPTGRRQNMTIKSIPLKPENF